MPSNTISILLTPVFILLASLMADSSVRLPARLLSFTLPVLFVAPLVTGIPAVLRLQFSVTAMAVILIALAQSRAGTQRPAGRVVTCENDGPRCLYADLGHAALLVDVLLIERREPGLG